MHRFNISFRDGLRTLLLVSALIYSTLALADGTVVDKIYHPYVDALENELEYRALYQDRHGKVDYPQQLHRLALGRSFGDNLFGEIYLVGEKDRGEGFDLEAWELEVKWQLTQQGEYAADWGLLFEFEDERKQDVHEVAFGVLTEREFGRFSGTVNLKLIGEWGDAIDDELDTVLSTQLRYRYSRSFEPALELYAGQDYLGLGPVALGQINLGIRKNLSWEAGVILGLEQDSPDQTFRLLFEFEF